MTGGSPDTCRAAVDQNKPHPRQWRRCRIEELIGNFEDRPGRTFCHDSFNGALRFRLFGILSIRLAYRMLGDTQPGSRQSRTWRDSGAPAAVEKIVFHPSSKGELRRREKMKSHERLNTIDHAAPEPSAELLRFKIPVDQDLLRIPLYIVLGEVEISAAQLFQLSRGQLFEFGFNPELPLPLVLAGETVAYGQVIRSAERIAVRIVSTAAGNDLEKNSEQLSSSIR